MSKAPPNTHRITAERNLEAILDAAERLLRRQQEPSYAAVAAEARVSRPTVYAHFPKRQALIEALVQRTVKGATGALLESEPDSGPAPEAFARLLAASWQQLALHQDIAQAAANELGSEAMRRSHHAARDAIENLIERGQWEGYWRRDLTPSWVTSCMLSLVHTAADEARARRITRSEALAALQLTTTALLLPAPDRPALSRSVA